MNDIAALDPDPSLGRGTWEEPVGTFARMWQKPNQWAAADATHPPSFIHAIRKPLALSRVCALRTALGGSIGTTLIGTKHTHRSRDEGRKRLVRVRCVVALPLSSVHVYIGRGTTKMRASDGSHQSSPVLGCYWYLRQYHTKRENTTTNNIIIIIITNII